MPETATSNYNENILPSVVDCSIQRIVKDKEDCASIPTRSTKSNTQIADYKQQKRQHFYLVVSNSKNKVKHVGQKGRPFNPKGKGRLALNFIHKIRGLWWSLKYLNVPTKLYVSPSKSLNEKNICNLRNSEIPNYVTYEGKHLKSNCSSVNKNVINKNNHSCNTLQNLRVNNLLRIIVGQLNVNSIRNKFDVLCDMFKQKIDILLLFGTKIDDTFPLAQFCVEGYFTPYRLDRTCKGGLYCCM